IGETTSRIKLVAETFHKLESNVLDLDKSCSNRTKQILRSNTEGSDKRKETPLKSDETSEGSLSELLNAKVLRRWMLDNIAFPYPTREEKEELARHTNLQLGPPLSMSLGESTNIGLSGTPITSDQCALWFTNGRRRSRWQEFNRTYGLNLRGRMEHIV
ncbi:hypothetical protein FA10DRAFT_219016, partial [Acaromyces ingoldii]